MTFRNDPCKTCGHDRSEHIYEMSACRPGFVCPHGCEFFVSMSPEPKTVTITMDADVASFLEDSLSTSIKNGFLSNEKATPALDAVKNRRPA